jgi:hypothetical protein
MPDSTLNPSLIVKPVDSYKAPTPSEQIPATPEAIEAAIEEASPISAAVVAESKPYKGHVFPLETTSSELYAFQQYLTNEPKYLANPAPLNMGWVEKKLFDPKVIINKMNFEAYWKLRAFQIQQMQKQLKRELEIYDSPIYSNRLNLKHKKNSEEFETDSNIEQIFNGIGKKEDRIAYLQQMLKLLEDVTITVDSNNTASIKKNNETLVAIKEDTTNGLNNMEFEIPLAVLNGDKAKLEHAIALMLDQATRVLERSHDTKKEFVISGYEDSPEVVLRMYYSALLQGLKPKIDNETLKYWDDHKTEDRFKTSLDKYKQLLPYLKAKPKKLKELRENYGHEFSLQQAKKEDAKDLENTTPSEQPKHAKLK